MQAKIEPGNINVVQLSPTIQATKSNFTRQHKGKVPAYLEWFIDAPSDSVVVDLLQSEQASRFLGKRNRNTIVYTDEDISVLPSHRWMTLGQIAQCMKTDNLVNMDTRTVLSCIPYSLMDAGDVDSWPSLIGKEKQINWRVRGEVHRALNDARMFKDSACKRVDLKALKNWKMVDYAFECEEPYPFQVIFCDISIEGREVRTWCQPLFEARGRALFGLLCRKRAGSLECMIRVASEIGSFDGAEIGPTIQREAFSGHDGGSMDRFFDACLVDEGNSILLDVFQSEEGGRFYHEENRNVVVLLNEDRSDIDCPENFFWCDILTLFYLCQEKVCNIQLRSLIALMGVLF